MVHDSRALIVQPQTRSRREEKHQRSALRALRFLAEDLLWLAFVVAWFDRASVRFDFAGFFVDEPAVALLGFALGRSFAKLFARARSSLAFGWLLATRSFPALL